MNFIENVRGRRNEADACAVSKGERRLLKEAERELQGKFEHLKRVHQGERVKLEDKRLLEEKIIAFSKKNATSEIHQNQTCMASGSNLKNKDLKNSNFM